MDFFKQTYAYAIELLPVGVALLLEYLAVPLVALVAFFVLREQVHFRLWLAVGCIIIGLAVVGEVWSSTLNPIGVFVGTRSCCLTRDLFFIWRARASENLPAEFIVLDYDHGFDFLGTLLGLVEPNGRRFVP